MPTFQIQRSVAIERTPRVMQLEGLFDLPPTADSARGWTATLPIDDRPWRIGLIVGASGSGKTTLARELFGDGLIDGFVWPDARCIVDAFPDRLGIKEITGLLSSVGFSSPPSWLRPFRVLSTGEQFRATVARALAESIACRERGPGYGDRVPESPTDAARSTPHAQRSDAPIVIDEFTSVVDRTVARIGSAAVAKAVRRHGLRFVAVTCHYDVIDWLQPDWQYEPATNEFLWRSVRPRPPIELVIGRAGPAAWRRYHQHHYLDSRLHPAARCFEATIVGGVCGGDVSGGRPAAFTAVLPFPHAQRPGWREHRTVCLPDFQGVGIGNAMAEFVASLYRATGKPYRSVTSHPAMIHHRARSPHWRMTRAPSSVNPQTIPAWDAVSACRRFTASFEYVGPPRMEAARRLGVK